MSIVIRPMGTEDADAKGYVHWKSCLETYEGLMDPEFLAGSTLEKCQNIARKWPGNTLVAEKDGTVVGFGSWTDDGEISALYVLRDVQGFGIGRKLMEAMLAKLAGHPEVRLWVLHGNDRAIGFYEHMGFRLDGVSEKNKYSAVHPSLRMVRRGN